jgi:hypothetical protein
MTLLLKLIANLCPPGLSVTGKSPSVLQVAAEERPSRFDQMRDEALMASMHCDAARALLDYLGPRSK